MRALPSFPPEPHWIALRATSALALLLALGHGACEPNRPGPEETLRKFLADARMNRADAVWDAISTSTQRELERRHRARAEAAGEKKIEVTPERLVFDELGLIVVNPPESIVIVSPPGKELTLRVSVKEGRSADIRMLEEGGAWKVDLLRSLKDAPPLEAQLKGPLTSTATVP